MLVYPPVGLCDCTSTAYTVNDVYAFTLPRSAMLPSEFHARYRLDFWLRAIAPYDYAPWRYPVASPTRFPPRRQRRKRRRVYWMVRHKCVPVG